MNILKAIRDDNLFAPFFSHPASWQNWFTALKVIYGLPVAGEQAQAVAYQCTGREDFLDEGFDTALFLTGRRSGKSRVAATIAAYEAVLAGHEAKLAKGECGVVAICAPTKWQGRIVKDYVRAVFDVPLLRQEVHKETAEGFELRTGTRIEIQAGDWRTIRGFTLLAAIVDEACFFGYDAECKVRSDTELIRAIKPSLATVRGKLVCISSPYAKKGWCYTQWKRNWANEAGKVLVWNCPSTVMNPTLPQAVVDEALAEDLQAAKSEYLGEFRDDVAEFLPRAMVEALVVPSRVEVLPYPDRRYVGFVDVSGGRADDAAVAIAHRERDKAVLDLAKVYKPPFNPHEVIRQMAEELKRYGIRRVTGDNYAAEFVARAFEGCGLRYAKCEKAKSALYAELLPRICSKGVELLDLPMLVDQLAGLERRVRAGGKDIIDHPPNGKDDLANAVAGVTEAAFARHTHVGAL